MDISLYLTQLDRTILRDMKIKAKIGRCRKFQPNNLVWCFAVNRAFITFKESAL